MKKVWAIGVAVLGLIPLQACVASTGNESSEQLGSTAEAVVSCTTNSGLNPTRAALAVAMADELGRWDPAHDLVISNGLLSLSASAVCVKNGCANSKGLLGLQDWHQTAWVDQNVFNPWVYNSDLIASVNRHDTKIDDLTRNNPAQLPPGHKLTLVGGPTNLGTGACGPHYVFQADHTDGTPLSSTEATNLGNALCFYGYGSCGGNPFVAYTVTGQGCPSGRTCVAVDPGDGDNGTTTTTTSGGAKSYPMNRVWNPTNTLLNAACTVTPTNAAGILVSKCSVQPSTCGWLYCVPR